MEERKLSRHETILGSCTSRFSSASVSGVLTPGLSRLIHFKIVDGFGVKRQDTLLKSVWGGHIKSRVLNSWQDTESETTEHGQEQRHGVYPTQAIYQSSRETKRCDKYQA